MLVSLLSVMIELRSRYPPPISSFFPRRRFIYFNLHVLLPYPRILYRYCSTGKLCLNTSVREANRLIARLLGPCPKATDRYHVVAIQNF